MITETRTRGARWLCAVAAVVLAAGLAPTSSSAQENSGRVSLSTGIDLSTAYFFRGILQRREGFIFQPYSDVSFNFRSAEQGLTDLSFTLGHWNSLHTTTDQHHHLPNWYETDFYTGFGFGFENFAADVTYTLYGSPSHAFATTHEIAVSAQLDDSEWLEALPLYPYATVAFEVAGGADGGEAEGRYLEVGIEPGVDFGDGAARFSVPVTVGFSLGDYYENGPPGPQRLFNDTFGFLGVGAMLAVPLPVAESFGAWEVSGGVQFLSLGEFLEVTNKGDQTQVIGMFGLSVSY